MQVNDSFVVNVNNKVCLPFARPVLPEDFADIDILIEEEMTKTLEKELMT